VNTVKFWDRPTKSRLRGRSRVIVTNTVRLTPIADMAAPKGEYNRRTRDRRGRRHLDIDQIESTPKNYSGAVIFLQPYKRARVMYDSAR